MLLSVRPSSPLDAAALALGWPVAFQALQVPIVVIVRLPITQMGGVSLAIENVIGPFW